MSFVSDKPAGVAAIRQILGDFDDATVARIAAIGATEAELLEAYQWVSADDEVGAETERSPSGRVGQICEILRSEEPDSER
jgi:hypothetical protein